jgi:hypothetical protein
MAKLVPSVAFKSLVIAIVLVAPSFLAALDIAPGAYEYTKPFQFALWPGLPVTLLLEMFGVGGSVHYPSPIIAVIAAIFFWWMVVYAIWMRLLKRRSHASA